jgi:small subunit ribosomal protein S18
MVIYRRKLSPIKINDVIDYKDVELLSKFLTEQGKILPRRVTGLTTKQQTRITKAVKRARILSLLPFVTREG